MEENAKRDAEVIAVVGFAHGVSHFFHLVIPALFPALRAAFDLSYTEVGALMTTFFIVSGIGQAVAGFAVDRFGALRVLRAGVLLLAVSGVLLASATGYAGLMLAALVAGMGNSVFHPADFTLLNRHVGQPRLGHAFAMHGLSGNLGWAAAPPFMLSVMALADWRGASLAAGALAGLALLVLYWRGACVYESPEQLAAHRQQQAQQGGALAFLRLPVIWLCFAFFLTLTVAFGALQNFLPAVLRELYGVSVLLAASAQTAYLLAGAAGMALGGFLSSRSQHQERIIAVMLGGAACMGVMASFGNLPEVALLPLFTFMGLAGGIAGPSRDLLVRQAAARSLGTGSFGRVYGFVYSGLDIGLASAPLLFGRFLDAQHPGWVLLGVACFQILALLTAAWVARQNRAEMA